MAHLLDMSLDDIIKRNRKSGGDRCSFRGRGGRGGRGRGRGQAHCMSSGPGPTRRTPVFGQSRTVPYLPPPVAGLRMLETGMAEEGGTSSGTKLYVSNLHYGVTSDDIKVLFSDVGELKRCAIHYDWTGKSKGTADVVFARHSDALEAIRRYNDLLLDGRPIKIKIIGGDFVPSAVPPPSEGSLGCPSRAFRSNSRDGFKPAGRRGQGGRGKKIRPEKVSAEALDADLEKYHEDALLRS